MSILSRPIASTIKQQVYQIIKDQICNGDFRPGEWLQENELANKLNVSRSPVREALRKLAGDGLVVDVPNKGVFVKEITPKDIEDIFDLRLMLESYAIQKSYANLTEEKKNALSEHIFKLKHAYDDNNLQQYIEIDTDLHNLIISLSGNNLVESTYDKVHSMIKQFRIYSLTGKQRFDESIKEHSDIVSYIIAGNVIEADRVCKIHLELAREKILEYMSRQNSDSNDSQKTHS